MSLAKRTKAGSDPKSKYGWHDANSELEPISARLDKESKVKRPPEMQMNDGDNTVVTNFAMGTNDSGIPDMRTLHRNRHDAVDKLNRLRQTQQTLAEQVKGLNESKADPDAQEDLERHREDTITSIRYEEDRMEERFYHDPNVKFIQWVAGHLGINDIRELLVGFARSRPLIFHQPKSYGKTNVEWHTGEERLLQTGQIQLSPTFVSARDSAYNTILLQIVPLSHREVYTMHYMITTKTLNELFARLTACFHGQSQQLNPQRYVTGLQKQTIKDTMRSVAHDLRRYIRSEIPGLKSKRRRFRGAYDSVEASMGFGPS